jgi:UDP-glucose 4-epimerase
MGIFDKKAVLITGGTGSLGKALVRRILSGEEGEAKKVIVFSRDEAKQHYMRVEYETRKNPTDEIIYNNYKRTLEFRIGDIRDLQSVKSAIDGVDIIVDAAALKQVPSCEYFPWEAVKTNVMGAENIVKAIKNSHHNVETVVGISTDKACRPVNVMGMTKAILERVFIAANISVPETNFICVRYGNVLASRGSVIPFFHEQIVNGGPVTVTTKDMTRFLLPLDKAVDTIFVAIKNAGRGETVIPIVPSVKIINIARALVGTRDMKIKITGIRPGEKIDEILISEEESYRTIKRGEYYSILPMLPELVNNIKKPVIDKEYSSADKPMTLEETKALLNKYKLMIGQTKMSGEFLR